VRKEKLKYESINNALLQRLKRRRDEEKIQQCQLEQEENLRIFGEELQQVLSKAQLKAFMKEMEQDSGLMHDQILDLP